MNTPAPFKEIVAVEIPSRTVAGSSLRVALVEEGGNRGVVLEEREAARLFPSFQRPMLAIDLDVLDEVLEAIAKIVPRCASCSRPMGPYVCDVCDDPNEGA